LHPPELGSKNGALQPQPKRSLPSKTTLADSLQSIRSSSTLTNACHPDSAEAFHLGGVALDARGQKHTGCPGHLTSSTIEPACARRYRQLDVEPSTLVTSSSLTATGARQSDSRTCQGPPSARRANGRAFERSQGAFGHEKSVELALHESALGFRLTPRLFRTCRTRRS
jgi:hypothetical protein